MTELVEILLLVLMAMTAGAFAGLVPGLGPASIVLIMYPWLSGLAVVELFVFYCAMIASVQYYGSVSSIVYGVPGEINNTPAVQYGHPEFRQGRGAQLLASTATASFLAACIGLMFFVVALTTTDFLSWFLDNKPRLMLLLLILISIVATVTNRAWAVVAVLLGIGTGYVGFDPFTNEYFLSSSTFLASGIPLVPLFLGFLVLPEILQHMNSPKSDQSMVTEALTMRVRLRHLLSLPNMASTVRGSIVGAIAGLIPSVGTSVSSILAANMERRLHQDPQRLVVAAEAANNAAATTVLIPFILLALPIVPSEAIIMSLAERQGFGTTTAFSVMSTAAPAIITTLLLVNAVNWILAGVFYKAVGDLYQNIRTYIYHLVAVLCAGLICYIGFINNQLQLYAMIGCLAVMLGCLVKDFSLRLAFVFAFFLSDPLTAELQRFVLFNF